MDLTDQSTMDSETSFDVAFAAAERPSNPSTSTPFQINLGYRN